MFDWSDTVFRQRNVTRRHISNTVLQPKDWGSEAESPEVCRLLSQVTDKLYYIMLYWVHLTWVGFELTASVVRGTDCKGSCKSTYHTITTVTAPNLKSWIRPGLWVNRKTSGESASLPQYLGCNTVFDNLICVYASHFFAGRPYHFNQTLRTANKF